VSAETNAAATLTTPGGIISFNPAFGATVDYYWLTDLNGLAQAPLRTARDPKPQAPGTILHPSLRNERLITVTGLVVAASGTPTRTAMCNALIAALESIESADGVWAWTDSTGASHSVAVRSDIAVDYTNGPGGPPGPKQFIFGLVAADPAIA
jgi:hypothetical protein